MFGQFNLTPFADAGPLLAQTGTLLAQTGGSFWMPPPSSTTAPAVDAVFNLILTICTVFFAIVVLVMVFFVVRYRRREGVEPQSTPDHNTPLELFWSAVPLVIVCYIFFRSFTAFMEMYTVPDNAYTVNVYAKKWQWTFKYPNGVLSDDLHVPPGRPVRLVMQSQDVIHSLWVPGFRIKMDVVPGRYTHTWFEATEPGNFDLLCTEYCGQSHYDMIATVVVHEEGQFESWLEAEAAANANASPVEFGERAYRNHGCVQCHTIDGSAKPGGGPSFLGIFGKEHAFTDGTSAVVDENYIRTSILEPKDKVRSGFTSNMPLYKGVVSDAEIDAIIAYIKSLK